MAAQIGTPSAKGSFLDFLASEVTELIFNELCNLAHELTIEPHTKLREVVTPEPQQCVFINPTVIGRRPPALSLYYIKPALCEVLLVNRAFYDHTKAAIARTAGTRSNLTHILNGSNHNAHMIASCEDPHGISPNIKEIHNCIADSWDSMLSLKWPYNNFPLLRRISSHNSSPKASFRSSRLDAALGRINLTKIVMEAADAEIEQAIWNSIFQEAHMVIRSSDLDMIATITKYIPAIWYHQTGPWEIHTLEALILKVRVTYQRVEVLKTIVTTWANAARRARE